MNNIFNIYLTIHLAGAAAFGAAILWAFIAIFLGKEGQYRTNAIYISVLGFLQFFSGSLLSLVSPSASPLVFCAKIGLYAAAIIISEYILYQKIKDKALFPAKPVYASILAGLLIACLASFTL